MTRSAAMAALSRRAGLRGRSFRVESLEEQLHEVKCFPVMPDAFLDSQDHLELHACPEINDPAGDRLRRHGQLEPVVRQGIAHRGLDNSSPAEEARNELLAQRDVGEACSKELHLDTHEARSQI